jgi:hypothetical protein
MNLYRKRTPEVRAVFYDGDNQAEVMEFLAATMVGPQYIGRLVPPCWVTVGDKIWEGVKVEQWHPIDFKTFFEPVGISTPAKSVSQKRGHRLLETDLMKNPKTSG